MLFLTGSVEPIRVLYQRWRVYIKTKIAMADHHIVIIKSVPRYFVRVTPDMHSG